ncbi:unnamed protein product, partial [Cyprideis torosa]
MSFSSRLRALSSGPGNGNGGGPVWGGGATEDRPSPPRNNSEKSPPHPSAVTKFKLAEFRYGREEFLALCDPDADPPEELDRSLIFVEQGLKPIAFDSMSDDEARMWQRGVNSDAVLRLARGGGSGPPHPREGNSAPPSLSVRGGRGGGRGVGRGGIRMGRGGREEEVVDRVEPGSPTRDRPPLAWRPSGGAPEGNWRDKRSNPAPPPGRSSWRERGSGISRPSYRRIEGDEPPLPDWVNTGPGSNGSFDESGQYQQEPGGREGSDRGKVPLGGPADREVRPPVLRHESKGETEERRKEEERRRRQQAAPEPTEDAGGSGDE